MLKRLKNLWLLPVLSLLFACVSTPPPAETPEKAEPAPEKAAEPEKEPQWVTVVEDEYFVSQETVKYEDGFVDGYRLYEYDDQGNLLKKSQIGSNEETVSEEIFSYNEDLLLMKSEFFSSGKAVSYSEFTYNGNKQLIEEQYFNPKGDLLAVSSYEYDDKARRSKWVSGDSGGIPMMYTEYEYKNDILVQMNYFMPDGELEGYTQLSYEGDVLVEEVTYSAKGRQEKKTEYMIENGMVAKALFYTGKTLARTVQYSYDAAGNVVEETTQNRHGDVIDIVQREFIVFSVEKSVLQ